MFKKNLFLSFSIFFVLFSCFSQNVYKSDSLISVLKKNILTKKETAILLETISFYHPKPDSALYFVKESLRLAEELKEPIIKAVALEGMGLIQQRLGNKAQSLEAIFRALSIYEQLDLKEPQGAVLTQIATHYLDEKEFKSAVDYLEKAYFIYRNSDKKTNEVLTLINLGEAYRLSGNLDKAKEAFIKALELNKDLSNDIILGYSLGNLGMIYSSKEDYERAKENLTEAIKILSQLNDDYSVSIYLSELSLIYKKENNFNLAESKLLEAYKLAKNAGLKEQIRDFSGLLVSLYEEKKNYDKALAYQKVYQTYQDSLVNKTNIKKIEQLKAGYEIDKRESEIERINVISSNRKNISIGLAIGILLFTILTYLLYKSYKRIRIINIDLYKREEEKALLLRELNHRVKNNLQMISSILNLQSRELTENSAKEVITSGRERVEALSLVHRKLYQEGVETKISISEYIEELVLNLIDGYNIAVKPKFSIPKIHIGIDKAIPIALIINELVTNSVKYAYENVNNPSLEILINNSKNRLIIEVKDNGVGFNEEDQNKPNSFGLKLISSLIEQLDGSFSMQNNNGTHSIIDLEI